jgi:hypothetical protein
MSRTSWPTSRSRDKTHTHNRCLLGAQHPSRSGRKRLRRERMR